MLAGARAVVFLAWFIPACGRSDIIDHVPGGDAAGDGAVVVDFEAESGEIAPRLKVVLDPAASGGAYLLDDAFPGEAPPPDGSGTALYMFEIQRPGTRDYYIRGLALAPNKYQDSFSLQIDSGPEVDYMTSGGDCNPDDTCVDYWQWVLAAEEGAYQTPWDPIPYPLGPGQHSLRLRAREGQSAIDRIQILDGLD